MKNLNLQETFFFIILILVSIGFIYVIGPFIMDIFMAMILAILFKKPMSYFIKRFKENNTKAALITLLIVLFVIVIPLTFIGVMVSKEVGSTYVAFTENWPRIQNYIKDLPEKVSSLPYLQDAIDDLDWNEIAKGTDKLMTTIAGFVFTLIQKTFINVGVIIVHFFIVMFLLYYLLADGKALIAKIQYLLPLKDSDEKELFAKLEQVTDALIVNTFMIGIIEGTFGGLLFLILGIPSPFFWGTIMVFLSIIPLVGANSVLVPMVIIQFAIGNFWTGFIILVIGVGAITINQNIIRNRLDGHKSGMHPAIMFLASMGGLVWLGVVGFLAGPMITALFLVLWHQFGVKYQNKLEEYNKG
ncbi:MAG: AI-2E family transporter [Bacteroidota bacterium]